MTSIQASHTCSQKASVNQLVFMSRHASIYLASFEDNFIYRRCSIQRFWGQLISIKSSNLKHKNTSISRCLRYFERNDTNSPDKFGRNVKLKPDRYPGTIFLLIYLPDGRPDEKFVRSFFVNDVIMYNFY